MNLQLPIGAPCPSCMEGTLYETVVFKDRSRRWKNHGPLVCNRCNAYHSVRLFKKEQLNMHERLHTFLKTHYFVILQRRDLKTNEIARHQTRKQRGDKKLFKQGALFARSYRDDEYMKIAEEESRASFGIGGKVYIRRGKNKNAAPKSNSQFSAPQSFSMPQIKNYSLRRQGKKGSFNFRVYEKQKGDCNAAKLYIVNLPDFSIGSVYYIPSLMGKIVGKQSFRKPRKKSDSTPDQKPLTNS